MKISTGGIGAVASAMACNAKSMFPYAWAWNAIGGLAAVQDFTISAATADPEGILHTSLGSSSSTYGSYIAYLEEDPDPVDKSGKLDLDKIDVSSARYMHGIFDMEGFPEFFDNFGSGLVGSLYYYDGAASSYNAVAGHSYYNMSNGKTVIVWDMTTGSVDGSGSGTLWLDMTVATAPTKFEPYWDVDIMTIGKYMVWCGMVLSDRILTDIPLPIKTHMG